MEKSVKIGALPEREDFIITKSDEDKQQIKCDQHSLAGVVSQRACVYSGARVVLNPIKDAYHLVHGPIGCASYTWDIRGSLTSGADVFRNSFSTDLREQDIVFGGEEKLKQIIEELVTSHDPGVIFIYSTCVVGVIGDDLQAICKMAEEKYGIRVIPVESSGFAGTKSKGYKAACEALLSLMGDYKANANYNNKANNQKKKINILGDYNLAGEGWILRNYIQEIGARVVAKFTGDSSCDEIRKAPDADLNIVQCAGSMKYLARQMEERYNIPFLQVSFLGLQDTIESLRDIARKLEDEEIKENVEKLISLRKGRVEEELTLYRKKLEDKKAAIYVGGAFKAISLIKQFNDLGIKTVMVGTQNGKPEDYQIIKELTAKGTVILDDANTTELERFMRKKGADILVGGVKDRALAYKLGIGFCDHNHERKHPLSGFEGVLNLARELSMTANSPVWKVIGSDIYG